MLAHLLQELLTVRSDVEIFFRMVMDVSISSLLVCEVDESLIKVQDKSVLRAVSIFRREIALE